jgi:hypothetical protein
MSSAQILQQAAAAFALFRNRERAVRENAKEFLRLAPPAGLLSASAAVPAGEWSVSFHE